MAQGVLRISPEVNKTRETFFKALFRQESGYIGVATLEHHEDVFAQAFFAYPEQLPQLLEYVNVNYQGRSMYFCPQLLKRAERTKVSIKTCTVLWSDLDKCPPEVLDPPPSIVVESSPGRWQGYWLMQDAIEPLEAEDLSHRIAYAYRDQGADQSGWDLTQLLRIPMTYNMKYEQPGIVPIVRITVAHATKYKPDSFNHLPEIPGYEEVNATPLPPKALTLDPDRILAGNRHLLDQSVYNLYANEPEGLDWSSALWQLEMLLLEAGLSREDTFAVCNAAKCNKFARDGKPIGYLWRDVLRASVRLEQRMAAIGAAATIFPQLLTDQERIVATQQESFVERFITWGKAKGDAAPQYFEAGAFTILSTLLSGPVKLPTSFGTILPNLWFLILADTTLTRKSTAMDLAMDLLLEVEADAVLATDGSIEGLMSSIASRPGRAGIFWRDEFSGLLAAIKQKDYLAGMGEALTKLYDGKYQKRILRKETIEIRDPIVLIFAGGIRSKILELLDHESITSGFLPRFVFIEAESDITNFRPIGPATQLDDAERGKLIAEMANLKDEYQQDMIVHVKEQKIAMPKEFAAVLTSEAWDRYNRLERDMLEYGLTSGAPEVFTPTMDRLAKSGLKCAVLLAASRQKPTEGKVQVDLRDVLHAFSYVQNWADYATDVVANIGKTVNEKRIELVMSAIRRSPGLTRSKLMQNYHLTARDADWILETLDQRGLVRRTKHDRTERIFPATSR